jgi:hypothetical protein
MSSYEKYSQKLEELDTLVRTGLRISQEIEGRTTEEWGEEISSQIFVKILLHTISIQKILPSSRGNESEHGRLYWDIASVSNLTRSVIDAYFAMYYLGLDNISKEVHIFRKSLWDYHGEYKRLKKLELIGSKDKRMMDLRSIVESLLEDIKKNTLYLSLSADKRKNIRKGNCAIFVSNTALCRKIGISEDYYKTVFFFLSSYVHCYPFAMSQLSQYSKDMEGGVHVINTVLDYLVGFYCQTLKAISCIFPDTAVLLASNQETIDLWCGVHKNFKGANA